MQNASFDKTVNSICRRKREYKREAYFFVREALDYTVKKLHTQSSANHRHVSGAELLAGIKEFSLKEFGPMTITVFRQWGITKTSDFGEIVFDLVETGLLGKTEEDTKDDFDNIYDFQEEFVRPFEPRRKYNRRKSQKASLTK